MLRRLTRNYLKVVKKERFINGLNAESLMGLADDISELYNELLDEKTKLYMKKVCMGLFAGTIALGIAYVNLTRTSVADAVNAMKGSSTQETPKEPAFEEILRRETNQTSKEIYALFPTGEKYTFYNEETLDSYQKLVKTQENKENKKYTLQNHLKLLKDLDDIEDKKYKTIITPKEIERKQ